MFKLKKDQADGIERVKRPKRITVITCAVIIAVIILNIFVSVIADRGLWYLDMTQVRYTSGEATMYTPSKSFLSLIENDAITMIEKVNEIYYTRRKRR